MAKTLGFTDYREYKNPFYKIFIGDATGQKLKPLPTPIARLVRSVEIFETFFSVDNPSDYSKVVIKLIEGSREPLSTNSVYTNTGPYNQSNTTPQLSNKSGMLADLPFSILGTQATPQITTEYEINPASPIKTTIDVSTNIVGNTPPKYLFQERNFVAVTWGYLDDNGTEIQSRTASGYILLVQQSFPQSSSPVTTITCQCRPILDQLNTFQGTDVGQPVANFFTKVNTADVPIGQQIQDIATKLQISSDNVIVSPKLANEILSKDQINKLPSNLSLKQNIDQMAVATDAYWDLFTTTVADPTNNKNPKLKSQVLLFVSRKDFESAPIYHNTTALTYRGPGSIIKSVDIQIDYALPIGSNMMGIDQDGKLSSYKDTLGQDQFTFFQTVDPQYYSSNNKLSGTGQPIKYEELLSLDPTRGVNPIPWLTNFSAGACTSEFHPSPGTVHTLEDLASVNAAQASRAAKIKIETIGSPLLLPGIMQVTGLGRRYSGKYRIIAVKHILDQTGYSCTLDGVTQAIASAGIQTSEGKQGQLANNSNDDSTIINQFLSLVLSGINKVVNTTHYLQQ